MDVKREKIIPMQKEDRSLCNIKFHYNLPKYDGIDYSLCCPHYRKWWRSIFFVHYPNGLEGPRVEIMGLPPLPIG